MHLIYAQDTSKELEMELIVSDEQKTVIFAGFIIAVIGIFLFLARDLILRKKTDYDKREFASKQNRDYEKYHSDWSDDYEEFGSRQNYKDDEEFYDFLRESGSVDYYKLLEVDRKATQEEIKKQYRKLAKKLHPDKSKSEETKEKMANINKAYEILSDTELREKYDRYISKTD